MIDRLWAVAGSDAIRHPCYDRTVKVAKLCYTLTSGDGMDELMRRFARRESEELFKQRCAITQHIIRPVIANINDAFMKVPRSDYVRTLRYEGDGENKKAAVLEAALAEYSSGMSVDNWLATRLLELNSTDPNTWLVTEWGSFDNRVTKARPYPFEVSSENAVDFSHDNRGELRYLTARTYRANPLKPDSPLVRLTLYMRNRTITLDEVHSAGEPVPEGAVKRGDKYWIQTECIPHNLGYVPAFRAGYVRDARTGGRTFVSHFDKAIDLFMKTIKVNSELDLTSALHAFPLVIRYAEDCDAEGCNDGMLHGDPPRTCTVCGGTGKRRPTSTQEEITLSMPRSKDEVIDLSMLHSYVTPPIEIIQWQDAYVDKLTHRCLSVIFNSEIFSQQQVTATATEKTIELQSVYDTLYPFALQYAQAFRFSVTTYAAVRGEAAGLTASLLFRRDFKLKSYDMLLDDLNKVNTTGASPVIRRQTEMDIARVMFADQPGQMLRYLVQDRINPFSGHAPNTVLSLLASDLVPRSKKVLYANLGFVLDELEEEEKAKGKSFYTLAPKDQDELVNTKLAVLLSETAPVRPTLTA